MAARKVGGKGMTRPHPSVLLVDDAPKHRVDLIGMPIRREARTGQHKTESPAAAEPGQGRPGLWARLDGRLLADPSQRVQDMEEDV